MSRRLFLVKILMFTLGTINNIAFSAMLTYQKKLATELGKTEYLQLLILTLSITNVLGAIIFAFLFNHLGHGVKILTTVFLSTSGLMVVYFS